MSTTRTDGPDEAFTGRGMRVQLLGGVAVGDADTEALRVGDRVPTLLAYLALHRHRAVPRSELIDVLWSGVPPEHPGPAFATVLTRARAAIDPVEITGRRELRLQLGDAPDVDWDWVVGAPARCDALVADHHLDRALADAQDAIDMIASGFLPGVTGEWVEGRRLELLSVRARLLGLAAHAALGLGGDSLAVAETAARALIAEEPYGERGYALLIDLHIARDEQALALLVFDELRTLLRDHLGVPPSPAMIARVETLLASGGSESGVPRAGLVEREAELDQIGTAVTAAHAGAGRLVVVRGEPGIGKTALLDAAAASAERAGMVVLRAKGIELERDVAYGALRELASPILPAGDDHSRGLAGARLAEVLSSETPPAVGALDTGPVAQAVLRDLAEFVEVVAAARPLALIVDDVQWVDPASARALAYLAHRVGKWPVVIVLAARQGAPGADDPLHALGLPEQATTLRPEALALASVSELLRTADGAITVERCAAYAAATGGNPFYVTELARALHAGLASEGDSLVPPSVEDLIAGRLARLAPHVRRLAEAVAVLGGEDVALRHAAALANVPHAEAANALDELAAAGLLRPHFPMTFLHPLVGSTVARTLTPARLNAGHLDAARLLDRDGVDPEQIAAHLLATEPGSDPWVVDRLALAVDAARRRGVPEAAVRYGRRLLAEPPPPADRAQHLVLLAMAEIVTLEAAEAHEHLRAALELTADPDLRLRAATLLVWLALGEGSRAEAAETLSLTLDSCPGADPELIARAQAELVMLGLLDPGAREFAVAHADLLARSVDAGETLGPHQLIAVGMSRNQSEGETPAAAADLLVRGIERLDDRDPMPNDLSVHFLARSLIDTQPHAAKRLMDRLHGRARRRGSDADLLISLATTANVEQWFGNLAEAERGTREALAMAKADAPGWLLPCCSGLASILMEGGDLEQIADVLCERERAEIGLDGFFGGGWLSQRGRWYLLAGDPEAALADFLEVARRLDEAGLRDTPSIFYWHPFAVQALLECGRQDEAAALAELELGRAAELGPRVRGIALAAKAATVDLPEAVALLRDAADGLRDSPLLLPRTAVFVPFGAALLASGELDEGQRVLRETIETADRCGMVVHANRARTVLRDHGIVL